MAKPFIRWVQKRFEAINFIKLIKFIFSFKFFRKITYVNNLKELFNRIDLESNAIPDKVKTFDAFRFGSS